jgi:hypothetical protein
LCPAAARFRVHGKVFPKIANDRDSLIFGNDGAARMPGFQQRPQLDRVGDAVDPMSR